MAADDSADWLDAYLGFAERSGARLCRPRYDEPLYHYTSAAGLKGMLESRAIRASDVRCMNDALELRHGLALIRAAAKRRKDHAHHRCLMRALRDDNFRALSVFAASFSECGDQLSQWRAYAEDGSGYAVGFNPQTLREMAPKEWEDSVVVDERDVSAPSSMLIKVQYTRSIQAEAAKAIVDDALHLLSRLAATTGSAHPSPPIDLAFSMAFLAFAASCKNDGFAEEREWRVVVRRPFGPTESPPRASFRPGRYGLTPYLTLPFDPGSGIVRLILGPKLHAHDSRDIARAVLANNDVGDWRAIEIQHAAASYR